jgi:hypothetical protein
MFDIDDLSDATRQDSVDIQCKLDNPSLEKHEKTSVCCQTIKK